MLALPNNNLNSLNLMAKVSGGNLLAGSVVQVTSCLGNSTQCCWLLGKGTMVGIMSVNK